MQVRAVIPPTFPNETEEALYHRLRTLESLFYVYHRNHQELTDTIAEVVHPQNYQRLWDFFNQVELVRTMDEITRLLHNFAASASTWVDISRRLVQQDYRATQFWQEYEYEISTRFHTNGLAGFIKGLRNFAVHRELPFTSARLTMHKSPNYDAMVAQHGPGHYVRMESNFLLNRDKLLEWSGWRGVARTYLLNAAEEIVVVDVVNQHYDDFYAFYLWLDQRLRELGGLAQRRD